MRAGRTRAVEAASNALSSMGGLVAGPAEGDQVLCAVRGQEPRLPLDMRIGGVGALPALPAHEVVALEHRRASAIHACLVAHVERHVNAHSNGGGPQMG